MGSEPARLSRAARRDLLEATTWIARDNPQAAEAFRRSVARILKRIATHPLASPHRPELTTRPFRFAPLSGFPYLVVYDPTAIPPLVLRIIHGARDLPTLLADP